MSAPDYTTQSQNPSDEPRRDDDAQQSAEELTDKLDRSERAVKRYQWLLLRVLVVLGIIWALFFQIVGITHMPSEDMYPRLDAGDLVLFYRLDRDVRAQDVVVLEKATAASQGEKGLYILRVIAVEGDTVEVAGGQVRVNGNALVESNIFRQTPELEGGVSYPLTLGPGECFVLGDARTSATDSRYFGAVSQKELLGTVITIVRRNKL